MKQMKEPAGPVAMLTVYRKGAPDLPKQMESHGNKSLSELEPHASVEDTSFKRRPDVSRPPAVGRPSRQHQRVEVGLTHVGEVHGVHEEARLSEPQLREGIQLDVRRTCFAVRVVLQALPSGVGQLEADAAPRLLLPDPGDLARMPGRERHLAPRAEIGRAS